ncbi:MAG: RsmD family RNA methyltransferase, partial [Gemmatimonadales bacterium]
LAAPSGRLVRPTTDRVREAWMSIAGPRLVGARVLDLFAGSGALGLEALSRGARHATFVELAPASLKALSTNIATLEAKDRTSVQRGDAIRWVEKFAGTPFDVAFADPPYGTGQAAALAQVFRRQPFAAMLGIEHEPGDDLDGDDMRRWGGIAVTFFAAEVA